MSEKPVKYDGWWPTEFLRVQPSDNPRYVSFKIEQWWVPDGEPWDSDYGKWVLVQPPLSQDMQEKLK